MKTRLLGLSLLALVMLLFSNTAGTLLAQEVESRRPSELMLLGEPVFNQTERRVSVDFIVREANGLHVPDLSTANFSLSELSENITVTSERRLPLTLAVIVDLSFGADDDIIRSSLRAFFDTYYQETDDVTFYILDGDSSEHFRVLPIISVDQAREVIDGLRRSDRYYSVKAAFQQVLNDLLAKNLPPEAPRYALYVGSFLNKPSEAVNTDDFRSSGIPFHVVQAHRFRQSSTTALRRLANTGGGLFAENKEDLSVLPGDPYLPVNILKVLYDAMAGSRLVYTLSYEPSISLEASRDITLTAAFPAGDVLTANFSYTWTFESPQVTFVDSQQLTVERKTFRPDQSSPAEFLVNEQTIVVQVNFPDGIVRGLSSLTWEVKDENADSVLRYEVQAPQLDAQNRTSFVWSLTSYTTFGETKPVTMVVGISDELGYTSETQAQGEVRIQPEPTLIPTATFTPTATYTPTPTHTPTHTPPPSLPLSIPAIGGITTIPETGNLAAPSSTIYAICGTAGLFVVVAVFVAYRNSRLRRREERRRHDVERQLAEAKLNQTGVATDPSAPDQPAKVATTTQSNEPKPFAKLVISQITEKDVIDRAISKLPYIPITKPQYYIGRDTARADLIINADYISPLHCKIEVRGTTFRVTDLSKNGTYVEGNPITEATNVPNKGQIWITPHVKLVIYNPDEQIQVADDIPGFSTVYRSTKLGEEVKFELPPGVSDTSSADNRPVPRDYTP